MAGVELKDMKKQLSSLEEEVEQARKQRDEVQARFAEVIVPTILIIIRKPLLLNKNVTQYFQRVHN